MMWAHASHSLMNACRWRSGLKFTIDERGRARVVSQQGKTVKRSTVSRMVARGCCALPCLAKAPVDGAVLNKIADAGFNHGEVVETAAYLADRIGGRMTNSPAMRTAERWTQDRF